jgi:hypothetical protein
MRLYFKHVHGTAGKSQGFGVREKGIPIGRRLLALASANRADINMALLGQGNDTPSQSPWRQFTVECFKAVRLRSYWRAGDAWGNTLADLP